MATTQHQPLPKSCFHYINHQIAQLQEAGRLCTAAHYTQTLRNLMRFRNNRDFTFDALTPQFALAYETWLREQHLCRNSSSFYLRIVRTVYNKAVAAGLAQDYRPFRTVYTGIDKTTKRAISMSDIRRIKRADLRQLPKLDFARERVFILNIHEERFVPYHNWEIRADERICTIGNKMYFYNNKDGTALRIKKRSGDFQMFVVQDEFDMKKFKAGNIHDLMVINKFGADLELRKIPVH